MIVKIYNTVNESLISLLSEKIASKLENAKCDVRNGIFVYDVSQELCESVLDELTEILISEGLDYDGNVNSIGLDVEQYIDLFSQE